MDRVNFVKLINLMSEAKEAKYNKTKQCIYTEKTIKFWILANRFILIILKWRSVCEREAVTPLKHYCALFAKCIE